MFMDFGCYSIDTFFIESMYPLSDVAIMMVGNLSYFRNCVYPSSLSKIILALVRFLILDHQPMKYVFFLIRKHPEESIPHNNNS
jgi:hypothetical protein